MDFAFLPEALPLWAAIALIATAFFSSALTAAFGLGGGLVLLAALSALAPAPAVIPVHGAAQLGANASRLSLQFRHAVWPIVLWFSAGGLIGAGLGGRIAVELPVWALRGGVAIFILFTVWGPMPKRFTPGAKTYFTTGAAGGFLTMFFGATGPIAATVLSASPLDRLNVTATHAACMVAQHGFKIIIFGALGFAYAPWVGFILAILLAGYLGAVAGVRFLHDMREAQFRSGFKIILTAIAFYLLGAAIWEFRTG